MPFGRRFLNGVTQPTAGRRSTSLNVAAPRPSGVRTGTRCDGHGPDKPATAISPSPRAEAGYAWGQVTEKTSSAEAGIVEAGHELTERTV